MDKLNDFKSEHHRLNEKLKEYDKEEVSEEHSLLDDEKRGYNYEDSYPLINKVRKRRP